MEANDLGSKKINNEQERNEGFSGENISENYDPSQAQLKPKLEIDQDGNHKIVQRATYTDSQEEHNVRENESLNRGVSTEAEENKTVEHKDRNSDIAANRYPNSHPDNHENRGNIKLDE
jgi:hypothetical protein